MECVIGGACHSTSCRRDRQPTGRVGPARHMELYTYLCWPVVSEKVDL